MKRYEVCSGNYRTRMQAFMEVVRRLGTSVWDSVRRGRTAPADPSLLMLKT